MQSICFWCPDFPKFNFIALVSVSACSFWNSLRQEYKLWCFFEFPNSMVSYGTAKESKTCACGMQKVWILEVRGRWLVNARARIFHSTHVTLHGIIHQKHSAPSAGSTVAQTAPCTSVLCSGSLHLSTLQRHPAPSAGSIAAPVAHASWNRPISAAEFIKILK